MHAETHLQWCTVGQIFFSQAACVTHADPYPVDQMYHNTAWSVPGKLSVPRSKRSTSQLEGYHGACLNVALKGYNTSAELAVKILTLVNARYNTDRQVGLGCICGQPMPSGLFRNITLHVRCCAHGTWRPCAACSCDWCTTTSASYACCLLVLMACCFCILLHAGGGWKRASIRHLRLPPAAACVHEAAAARPGRADRWARMRSTLADALRWL